MDVNQAPRQGTSGGKDEVDPLLLGAGAPPSGGSLHVYPWPIVREASVLGVPGREGTGVALRRDATFRRALAVADVGAAVLALAAPVVLASAGGLRPGGVLLAVVFAVVAAKTMGLYDRDELVFHKSTLDEGPSVFHLAVLYAAVVWFVHRWCFSGRAGELEILLVGACFAIGDMLLRFAARRVARTIAPPERCLIVGKSSSRMRIAAKLAQTHSRIQIVGTLPLDEERVVTNERRGRLRPGRDRRQRNLEIGDLDDVVDELEIHRVIIVPGSADPDEMLDSIGRAKSMGVKVSIVPRLFEVVGSSVEFDDLEGLTVLGIRRFGLTRSSAAIKRATDLAGSALLLVVLSPLFAVTALLIRLDSRGPVFFRQARIGLDGQAFEMFKFRSMVDGADAQRDSLRHLNESEGLFKIADDPRLTRVGRWLRRTAIDELPQLINVLLGDMSLVGPRPLVADEDRQVEGRHRGRLRLTPGITGPWQLLGPGRVPLNEMVTIDYLYGANWSLWNDAKILLRTVAYVLHGRGM
jgi:exopolysaccharide biosynthesis polyprenyl glycosylphosphotransferase